MCSWAISTVDAAASWSTLSAQPHLRVAHLVLHLQPLRTYSSRALVFLMFSGASHAIASLPSSQFHPYSVKAVWYTCNISNKPYINCYIMHRHLAFNLHGRSRSFAVEECHIAAIQIDLLQCSLRASINGMLWLSLSALCHTVLLML